MSDSPNSKVWKVCQKHADHQGVRTGFILGNLAQEVNYGK